MKKIPIVLLTSVIFLSITKSFAQFTQMWMQQYQHTAANNYSSESRKVIEDASGNVYMLSDATSNLDSTGAVAGGTHHYTVINKYSAGGVRLHRKAIEVFNHVVSGFDNLGSFGLEVDANGNVYIGYSPYSSVSNYNVAIAKYDSTLTRIWVSQYGTSGSDVGVDMKLAASGMLYLVAKTVNGGSTTYSILRTNSGNAPVTVFTYPANTDVINSLALGSNEDVYVTGYRTISGAKTVLMQGFNHTTLLSKWISTYNGGLVTGDDYGTMITVGADGNIYAVGTSTQSPIRGTDLVILKHAAAVGTKMSWTSLQHYSTADFGNFISVPEIDHAYVGGVTGNAAATNGNHVILYRVDITSVPQILSPTYYQPIPASSYTMVNGVTLNAMKVSSGKKVYITGAVTATDASGNSFSASYLAKFSILFGNVLSLTYRAPVTGSFSGNYKGTGLSVDYAKSDIYWMQDTWNSNTTHQHEFAQLYDMDVTGPLRESKLEISPLDISVFPNPASDKINIKANSLIVSAQIADLSGRIVKCIECHNTSIEISVSDLKKGLYICNITLESGDICTNKINIE